MSPAHAGSLSSSRSAGSNDSNIEILNLRIRGQVSEMLTGRKLKDGEGEDLLGSYMS